jgi:hypothetical protein
MFSGSPVYSPGDNYPGQVRPNTRDYVGSTFRPVPMLAGTAGAMAIAAGVALAVIFVLGRRK